MRLFGVFGLLLILIFLPACDQSVESNQKQVVLYCSVDQTIAEPILSLFEKQSGIKVLARFDTEASKTLGLVQRIRAEAAAPVADVFWSSEVFHTIRLANESLLTSYQSHATEEWPKEFCHPLGLWYGFGLRGRVIAYNTQRISPEEAPRRLEDLLDKKWRGRLVMARPEFGTTAGDVASWFVHYGKKHATELLQGLKDNDVHLVAGNSTAVRWVYNGQADICLTDTDDVYAAQRNGWPIAMNFLRQGEAGPLAIPNTACLIKDSPHPDEAKILMAFLLSEKLEELLAASDSHNAPIHLNLRKKFDQYAINDPLEVNFEKVADLLPEAIRTAREIFK